MGPCNHYLTCVPVAFTFCSKISKCLLTSLRISISISPWKVDVAILRMSSQPENRNTYYHMHHQQVHLSARSSKSNDPTPTYMRFTMKYWFLTSENNLRAALYLVPISSVSHHHWLTPFTACLESAESVFCLPSINTGVPLNSTAKISYFCNLMSILQHGYYFVLSIFPLREYWRYK